MTKVKAHCLDCSFVGSIDEGYSHAEDEHMVVFNAVDPQERPKIEALWEDDIHDYGCGMCP